MTTTNIGPCGCCGGTMLDCEAYSVEAHWNGLTLAITPITPGDGTTAVSGSGSSGSGSSGSGSSGSGSSGSNGNDEYRLGIFRKEYFGRVAGCFIGSWEGGCIPVPNSANAPRAAECFYSCSCVDLDTNAQSGSGSSGSGSSGSGFSDSSGSPCDNNTIRFEYTLTGHFVTVYEPVEQSCDAHWRAWGCGFRGQFSVWKYTYVVVGGEASGQADVEELLYGDEYGNGEYSFIPCDAYTPPTPTVTIFF